jgi:antibiotic biosynthesis monooxygenase (ABM) superfamily enzyme
MRNKKLIPFEVIEKAVAGEAEAIDIILKHYSPRIKYLSKYRGHINDDIQDRLKAQLIKAILQFRFDRQ